VPLHQFSRMSTRVQFIVEGRDDALVLRDVPIPERGSQIQIHETVYDVREVVVVYSSTAGEEMFVDVYLSRHEEPTA
jgi:hypothetical protein